ncbi:MAG: hypothetical protein A2X94_02685 [Bdellovibrionales bacterium GWB1_55_8]|nr:MAG: hypothetical protein A2X94_02685 [Bdellovibrionales bacterium GWB1_55_8]
MTTRTLKKNRVPDLLRKSSFFLAVFLTIAPFAQAQQLVPAKRLFSVDVSTPTVVSFCGNSVWAYSVKTGKLNRLHPDTGAVQSTVSTSSLGIQGSITAIGCAVKDLLIGTNTNNKSQIYRYPFTAGTAAKAKALQIAGKGLIRDLFCREGSNACFAIRDSIYYSGNLQTWAPIGIPKSDKVGAAQEKIAENPFAGWQDQFIITEGQYFRGQLLGSSLYLLDPLRSAVVITGFGSEKGEQATSKWGKWGVWEGQLMWAKGMASIGNEFIAISDTGLKLVFIFTRTGEYVGSLGADGGAMRFQYPLDIASSKNRLYVADPDAGKVIAFELSPAKLQRKFELPQKAEDLEEVLRKNLFRDPAVLADRLRMRCLGCHDGLEADSLKKFVGPGEHHPLNVEPATKIDLPLEGGKFVTCSSCHDSHHAARDKKGSPSAMLRKQLKPLCITCHASKGVASLNHPQMSPEEGCAECHAPHGSNEYLLKTAVPALCTDCHGADIIPAAHPDSIDCTSCHSLHDAQAKFKFATHSAPNSDSKVTCLACHHEKKSLLGKNYHMGEESTLPHPWPQPEAVCMDCHNPHKKVKDLKQVCSQCHDGITGTHPAAIPIAETEVAKAVHLRNGKVACSTCHEPHGTTPPNANGRSFFKDPAPILPFCASCHGSEADEYYKNFHKRTK